MAHVVALEKALPSKGSQVLKLQTPGDRIWKHYGSVEINQVAVVHGVPLTETDTVGIVTRRTWRIALYMFLVLLEAFVFQDALAIVAAVA